MISPMTRAILDAMTLGLNIEIELNHLAVPDDKTVFTKNMVAVTLQAYRYIEKTWEPGFTRLVEMEYYIARAEWEQASPQAREELLIIAISDLLGAVRRVRNKIESLEKADRPTAKRETFPEAVVKEGTVGVKGIIPIHISHPNSKGDSPDSSGSVTE